MKITYFTIFYFYTSPVFAFWDMGTTTPDPGTSWRWDEWVPRTSRFRWQRSEKYFLWLFFPHWDWWEIDMRRRLYVIAGISYKMKNLSTAAILNRRTLVTGANYLDPYMHDVKMVRVWALGRKGANDTPYRYRVWRITRILPKSLNPEHQHGPYGYHSPRHDVAIIHTLDQIYVYHRRAVRYAYPYRAFFPTRSTLFTTLPWYAGCGYEYQKHVQENYKIFYSLSGKSYFRDCSEVLPKWWGKFICITNHEKFTCVQNGGPFFDYHIILGIGSFEIRYNDDSVFAFTDLRYYMDNLWQFVHIAAGEYYEYAYPQWSVRLYWFWYSWNNEPTIPKFNLKDDLYPMGR